jgi:glycosyltransferase involved in cell wall biosynthesis
MPKVLHIMPHMGPGVGKALSALAIAAAQSQSAFRHAILLLEKPITFDYIELCQANGIEIRWNLERAATMDLIARTDIVQLEWWHHPLVLGFLEELSTIPIRLTVWSHISGCNYPLIPAAFVTFTDHFFFTTAYSYENPFWLPKEKSAIQEATTVACGSGGFGNVSDVVPKPHKGFTIGYVGTLDFRKLHPEFIDFCARVDVPDTRFILVGMPENRADLTKQAMKKKLAAEMEFTGYTKDVKAQFERFDIFSYLLNPDHYGTTDNVLLEAMGAGMAIIVLNQCGEKHVIKHMQTGIVVNSMEEYGQAVRYLYDRPQKRKALGRNARRSALREFSPQVTMRKLHTQYDKILSKPKRRFRFREVFGKTPYQWFLSGLGKERVLFDSFLDRQAVDKASMAAQINRSRDILRGPTKSSIPHFHSYFPFDAHLRLWNNVIVKKG